MSGNPNKPLRYRVSPLPSPQLEEVYQNYCKLLF